MSVKQLFDLTGKVALITGGSRGLGLQMAEALGEMGAKVAITARKQHELDEAAKQLREQGVVVLTIAADLSQTETIPGLVDRVTEELGPIDILVNNAGASWGANAEDHPAEAWHKVMDLNINSIFLLSQEVGKRCMIPRKSGKIISIASVAGLIANLDLKTLAYNTSKGAVLSFTRALATEWGKYNINVNAMCPGYFPSKMTVGTLEQLGERACEGIPLQRLGSEEDLKGAICFLASDASNYMTGQQVVIDGGMSIC